MSDNSQPTGTPRTDDVPLPALNDGKAKRRLRILGVCDRLRYRDIVKDGNHTHASRWMEATANHGLSDVDAWERKLLASIEHELAGLRTELLAPAPAETPTDFGIPPTDPPELVRWNRSQREHAARVASVAAAASQSVAEHAAHVRRRSVLEADHRSVRLAASHARERWITDYYERVDLYSRHRVSRRGLRPAPEANAPAFVDIDNRRLSTTSSSGDRIESGDRVTAGM